MVVCVYQETYMHVGVKIHTNACTYVCIYVCVFQMYVLFSCECTNVHVCTTPLKCLRFFLVLLSRSAILAMIVTALVELSVGMREAVARVKGICVAGTFGWWQYEACVGSTIQQFSPDQRDRYLLGVWMPSRVL